MAVWPMHGDSKSMHAAPTHIAGHLSTRRKMLGLLPSWNFQIYTHLFSPFFAFSPDLRAATNAQACWVEVTFQLAPIVVRLACDISEAAQKMPADDNL